MTNAAQAVPQAGVTAGEKKKWWALGAICFGLFMALLDITIVNVALPSIQADLHADFTSLEWVINTYTLVLAVALVTSSRIGDIVGRKAIFIAGLAVFTAGSLLCALSGDISFAGLSHIAILNIFRGVQGLGASAMMPLSLAILSSTFRGKQRGIAFGIWGGVNAFAVAIGPLIGGALVDQINWQSIFYLNVPIGIIGICLSIWAIQPSKDESAGKRIDLFGFVMVTIFMFCLIYGFIRTNNVNLTWTSPEILGWFSAAALALLVFIIGELKIKHPMADPRLFKVPSFTGACIAAFCLSAGLYALIFYLSLYFQNFLGFDALQTGLRFVVFSAFSFLVAPISGALMGKTGPKWLIVGALVFITAGVWLLHVISPTDRPADWVALLPAFILAGIGSGLINPPVSDLSVRTVDYQRAGMAAGINNVSRQIGIAFGTAYFGAILSNRYAALIADKITALQGDGLTADVKRQMIAGIGKAGPIAGSTGLAGGGQASPYQSMPLFGTIQEIARSSFVEGIRDIIGIAAVIAFIGLVLSIALIRRKDLKH